MSIEEKIRDLVLAFEEAASAAEREAYNMNLPVDLYDEGAADTYRLCARKLRELVEH